LHPRGAIALAQDRQSIGYSADRPCERRAAMSAASLDVGAILRRWTADAGAPHGLTGAQRRVVHDLAACRTPRLGGRLEQCSACLETSYVYNSCRNRHCPKCQAGTRAAWLAREAGLLLPVE